MTRRTPRFWITLALALVALVLIPAALAAKGGKPGGGGGKGGKPSGATGSFTLVMIEPSDTVLNHGDDITFDVTSTATYPFVDLDCYQGATLVLHQSVGFYGGWPWSQVFTLGGWAWPGGAGDCNARLYDEGSGNTLATMSFHVYE